MVEIGTSKKRSHGDGEIDPREQLK